MPDTYTPEFLACFPLLAAWPLLWGIGYQMGQASARRGPEPEPDAFRPSMSWTFEAEALPLVRALPVGVGRREAEPVQTVQFKRSGTWLNNDEAGRLARLIVASGQPPEGVKLTHALMKEYGWTADPRRKDLLKQIVARGKGYTAGTTGGKFTVVLKPEVAARHVERCRARGLAWQLSPTEGVGVGGVQSGGSYTYTEKHGNMEE